MASFTSDPDVSAAKVLPSIPLYLCFHANTRSACAAFYFSISLSTRFPISVPRLSILLCRISDKGSDEHGSKSHITHPEEPLDNGQAHHVRLSLDAALTAVSDLDGQISKAVLDLLKLENERRLRSKTAATLKGVLSALRRVPSEILLEIFFLCRDDSLSTSSSTLDPR
ncbi:hypothetical protein FB451DRAFT_1452778 [Mycena latifolia]|nr:hypothetical protein FB451DRAFT_1452778 [Mycena latifolia]